MVDGGAPVWWQTRTIPGPKVDGGQITHGVRYYALFEFFSRNAQKYAFLRVSLSDGMNAWENTFSHEEAFARNSIFKRSDEVSAKLRTVLDDAVHDQLEVKSKDAEKPVVIICLDQNSSEAVQLELKVKIDGKKFVDRVMSYLAHVEAQLKHEQEGLQEMRTKRQDLMAETESLAKLKQEEDNKIEVGMKFLMDEKRRHWG